MKNVRDSIAIFLTIFIFLLGGFVIASSFLDSLKDYQHYLVRDGKSIKVKNCRIVDGAVRYTTHHHAYHVEACVKNCACVRTEKK